LYLPLCNLFVSQLVVEVRRASLPHLLHILISLRGSSLFLNQRLLLLCNVFNLFGSHGGETPALLKRLAYACFIVNKDVLESL
jgi:hypothetical protein